MTIKITKAKAAEVAKRAPSPAPKRKAGQRAGLSLNLILQHSKNVLAKGRPGFTVKAVAESLKVADGSVSERLRREGATLESLLAWDFLAEILPPMEPGDHWKTRIHGLFERAFSACVAVPNLAVVVTPWVSQGPQFNLAFTDRLLYILRESGLSWPDCALAYDHVMSTLCGTLLVAFPELHGGATPWVEKVKTDWADLSQRQLPILYGARNDLFEQLAKKASGLAEAGHAVPDPLAAETAEMVIAKIISMNSAHSL